MPDLMIRWPQMRLAVQTAFSTVAVYGLVQFTGLQPGYWAILTAMLVVQSSIGASLALALERLFATLLGATVGVLAAVALSGGELHTFLSLFLTTVGLTYFSARPPLRLAPVTAAIVILSSPGKDAVAYSAMGRVLEIGLGAAVGVTTSFFLFPLRSAEALLHHVSALAPMLSEGICRAIGSALGEEPDLNEDSVLAIAGRVQTGLGIAEGLSLAAQKELAGFLAHHGDPAALLRALRRVWNTEVIALRAVRRDGMMSLGERAFPVDDPQYTYPPNAMLIGAWPDEVMTCLAPALREARAAAQAYFAALDRACSGDGDFPGAAAVKDAAARLDSAIVQARREGRFRQLGTDDVARLFALTLALEQLPQNLTDLSERCREMRRGGRAAAEH